MALGLALALIVFVVVAVIGVIGWDFRNRPAGAKLTSVREWQSLLGAVLGFLGAAGVLVVSTALQRDTEQRRQVEQSQSIGLGLALEVEHLSLDLQGGQYMATHMTFDGDDAERQCLLFFSELKRLVDPETPVYDAVLPRMVDFGDTNLSWFVRFYGIYNDINRQLAEQTPADCGPATAANSIAQVQSLLNGGMKFYAMIADRYQIAAAIPTEQLDAAMETAPVAEPAAPATTPAN